MLLTPPGTTFRVGGGPYTVPISITNVSRLSTVTLTLTVRPGAAARAGRQGRQLHALGRRERGLHPADRAGRVDITITRAGDATGASGTGLLGAVLFDAVAPGTATLTISGTATGSRRNADGAAVPAGDGHGSAVMRALANQRARAAGYTFVELLVVSAIVMMLASAVMPLARVTATRQREAELRRALREMRTAIDKYKDAADLGRSPRSRSRSAAKGYPADLETLVEGVAVQNDATGRKLKFLRRIPIDPMTARTDWGLRSYQDEPDATRWGGQNVFDVYTTFEGTALDGTKYRDW